MVRFLGHAECVLPRIDDQRLLGVEAAAGRIVTNHEGTGVVAVSWTHEERDRSGTRVDIRHVQCLRRDTNDSPASKVGPVSNAAAL
jgi:hypothetical protein